MKKYTYKNNEWLKTEELSFEQEQSLIEIEDLEEQASLNEQFTSQLTEVVTSEEAAYLDNLAASVLPSPNAIFISGAVHKKEEESNGVLIFKIDKQYKIVHF